VQQAAKKKVAVRGKQIGSAALLALLVLTSASMLVQARRYRPLPIGALMPGLPCLASLDKRSATLPKAPATLVVRYENECDRCAVLLANLQQENCRLQRLQIVLLTSDPESEFAFVQDYPMLSRAPNVVCCSVPLPELRRRFGRTLLPALYLFDSDRRLQKRIAGAGDWQRVIDMLEQTGSTPSDSRK